MKDFFIFIIGTLILFPIVFLVFSGSVLGFFLGMVYLLSVIMSAKIFPKFWIRWFLINMYYSAFFENRK